MTILTKKEFLAIYARFYDAQKTKSAWSTRFLPLDKYSIGETESYDPLASAFDIELKDHQRLLINSLNQFGIIGGQLDAWWRVHNETPDQQERLCILYEMILPVFRTAMDYPYSIRSSFYFAACKSLKETARLLKVRIDFEDNQIYASTLDRFAKIATEQNWTSFGLLSDKLSKINANDFQNTSRDYRSRVHHRIQPDFGIGERLVISRWEDAKATGFTFGVEKSLTPSQILPLLLIEYDKCVEAFDAYWSLANELKQVWKMNERKGPFVMVT